MPLVSSHHSELFKRDQYKSKLGRRPPFYPLSASTHIDDPSITIENLELADTPSILIFRSTPEGLAAGGVRAWNEEHEAIIRWFLEPTSPILVDPRFPDQHAAEHLSEVAFAARLRMREDNELRAEVLADYLNNDPDYEKLCLKRWKRLSQVKQEALILSVLASFEPPDHLNSEEPSGISKNRKLTPELTLSKLCASGGKGLEELLKLVARHSLDPVALSEHPISNDAIFKKFGIVDQNSIPLPKADRAFQDLCMLKRNWVLLMFTQTILSKLSGKFVGTPPRDISTFRSEISRSNLPTAADRFPQGTSKKTIRSGLGNFSDELCSTCKSTAKDRNLKCLLFCQRCKKVDRIQPYCSSDCQRTDWNEHKMSGHCGSRLSTFTDIPIISSAPFVPNYPAQHSNRRHLLYRLNSQPSVLWTFKCRSPRLGKEQEVSLDRYLGYVGVRLDAEYCDDPIAHQRMLSGMREIAYESLRDGTQSSIDILAFVLISSENQRVSELRQNGDPNSPVSVAKETSFRNLFDLRDERKWNESLARGAIEIEKPGREVAKEYHAFQKKCFGYHMVEICSGGKPGTPKVMQDLMKAMFMSMLKDRCAFSDEEIVKAFNALDCEALDKAMADSTLSPDKAGTEEEEGEIGEEKDGPDESKELKTKPRKNKKKSKK